MSQRLNPRESLIAVMASVARAASGKGKQGLVRIHSSLVGSGGVGTPAGPEMKRKYKEIFSFKPFFGKLRNQVLHDLHVRCLPVFPGVRIGYCARTLLVELDIKFNRVTCSGDPIEIAICAT